MFGVPYNEGDEVKHKPFHSYTMKQAIQEGFIMDVLKYYTPVNSYYKLAKTIEDDPLFDSKKSLKKLRKYVESNEYAVMQKAEIMIDHFHQQVIGRQKIGGQARAMIITSEIEKKFKKDPYRFLIVADKFQTGFDEPLLHTMYVDKPLSDIKAVQTLSRLNRAHPKKYDTFVLDFVNDTDTIKEAFEKYYRTTVLSQETDPNKLYDLQTDIENYQVFSSYHVDTLADLYLKGAQRDRLDPILDECVLNYKNDLDEDGQVDFKSKSKTFCRTYNFISSLLTYGNANWEKLSMFLNLLIPKLPAPKEDDLSKGILEAIDMDSYRVEVQTTMTISLADNTELYKQFSDNQGFKKWLSDMVFDSTYNKNNNTNVIYPPNDLRSNSMAAEE